MLALVKIWTALGNLARLAAAASAVGLLWLGVVAVLCRYGRDPGEMREWLLPGTVFALTAGAVWMALRWRGARMTAAGLDRKLKLKNRLESLVELTGTARPIRARQAADAVAAWGRLTRGVRIAVWLPLAVVFAAPALWQGATWSYAGSLERRAAEAAAGGEAAAGAETPEDPAVAPMVRYQAKIAFTWPEEEAEFMPIDLVEWEAGAEATLPWRSFELAVTRNGAAFPASPVAFSGGGKLFLAGAVALDELDARALDLVTLQLAGVLEDGGAGRRVFSDPMLIHVKPLRDEIHIRDASDMEGGQLKDFMHIEELIRRQTELLKLFFSGRSMVELGHSDRLGDFALLAEEQAALGVEVTEFVREHNDSANPLGALSAEATLHLQNSAVAMAAAAGLLAEAAEDWAVCDPAAARQQEALAGLYAALDAVSKFMPRPGEEPPKGEPGPTVDSKVREMLVEAISQEKKLLELFNRQEFADGGALSGLQGDVSATLRLLNARAELSDAVLRELGLARDAGEKAEVAILSNAATALTQSAQEALRRMEAALLLLDRENQGRFGEALEKARQQLAEAQRRLRAEGGQEEEEAGDVPASGGTAAGEAVAEIAMELTEQARELTEAGAPSLGEQLDALAESFAAAAGELPGAGNGAALEMLDALRRELKARQGEAGSPSAAELAERVERLEREAAYLERLAEAGEAADPQAWLEEFETAVDDIRDRIARQGGRSESLRGRHGDREPSPDAIPSQLSGWFYQGLEPGDYELAIGMLQSLARLLESMAEYREPVHEMFMFSPDQVPEEYREVTLRYLEMLSRWKEDGR